MIPIAAALSSALLLVLSFPRFHFGFLAWVGLAPLLVALKGKSLKTAFGLSFLFGIAFMMGVFYWINTVPGFTPLNFLLLGIYFGTYFGVFGLLLNFIATKRDVSTVFAAPSLWVSLEFLRSHAGFLSLPWALLAHSQYLYPPLIQFASMAGAYGVSFLIVAANATLAESVPHLFPKRDCPLSARPDPRWWKAPVIGLLLVATAVVYGMYTVYHTGKMDTFRVSVIQGNIPQSIKWNPEYRNWALERHVALSENAALVDRPSLIVWPESSIQGSIVGDFRFLGAISNLAKRTDAYVLVGSAQRSKIRQGEVKGSQPHGFNGAFLFSPKGAIVRTYNKIHLLPFAEYLPWKEWFPWPERFRKAAGSFIPGKEYTVFDAGGARFSVPICWETVFPEIPRGFANHGARFLLNITNEAWFGATAAPYQFLSMTVFRAVENRLGVARSANTGISCFIDPFGRILGRVEREGKDIFVDGFLTMDIPLHEGGRAVYSRYGDIFAYASIVLSALLVAISVTMGRTAREGTGGTP